MTFAPRFERPQIASKGRGRSGPPPRVQEAAANQAAGVPMSFPGPSSGLSLFDNVATVPDTGALVLENFVVGNSVTRARRGMLRRNNGALGRCGGIGIYTNGPTSRAFAIAGNSSHNIYDISSGGDIPSALVSGLVASNWSFVQFANPGGEYLVAVSVGNVRHIYDGASWATTPTIDGALDDTKIKQVWIHGSRQWFIENDTLNAWYLPVDNIGGTAVLFPLAGQFKKGGYLVAGASWTVDASDTGIQSACIMITSEGEVAVYEGTDPDTNFSIKGVYQIGKPCGINCFMKTGGDVAVMTDDGLVAMSQVVSLDAAALSNQSVSKNIRPIWSDLISRTDKDKWRITRRDDEGYAIVSVPAGSGSYAIQLVANLQTGAWSVWTGWNVDAISVYGNDLIFCDPDGVFCTGEVGGSDNGEDYTCTYIGPYRMNDMQHIHAKLMRVVLQSTIKFKSKVTALFDYSTTKPANPPAITPFYDVQWDVSLWDQAVWGGGREAVMYWNDVSGNGTAIAPCVQFTFNQVQSPEVDLIRTDFIVENGSIV